MAQVSKSQRYFFITAWDNAGVHGVVEQTSRIMQAVELSLTRSGLGFHDVRKATTYYVAGGSAAELHDNMKVRMPIIRSLDRPRPDCQSKAFRTRMRLFR